MRREPETTTISEQDLALLLKEGEGHKLEFNERLGADLDRELVGFANAAGGTILLGVTDAGRICGIVVDNEVRSRLQDTAANCDPPVRLQCQVLGNVLAVHVPEGTDKPYRCAGGFYTRMGPNTQKLTRRQIIEFLQSEGKVRWEELLRPDLDLAETFHPPLLKAYLRKAGIVTDMPSRDVLRNLGVTGTVDGRTVLTNAGVLFFGRRHELTPTHTNITCGLFKGTARVHILDRKDFAEDIVANIDNALVFLQRHRETRDGHPAHPQAAG